MGGPDYFGPMIDDKTGKPIATNAAFARAYGNDFGGYHADGTPIAPTSTQTQQVAAALTPSGTSSTPNKVDTSGITGAQALAGSRPRGTVLAPDQPVLVAQPGQVKTLLGQ